MDDGDGHEVSLMQVVLALVVAIWLCAAGYGAAWLLLRLLDLG